MIKGYAPGAFDLALPEHQDIVITIQGSEYSVAELIERLFKMQHEIYELQSQLAEVAQQLGDMRDCFDRVRGALK